MKLFAFIYKDRRFRSELAGHRARLYRIAYAWCHDPCLADDLVQETMARALKNAGQLRDPEAMGRWLFKILANLWRESFRKRRNMVNVEYVGLANESTPETEYARRQIVNRVREAIAALPEDHRQTVTLVDLEGFSYGEVAQILGAPIGTVMSRLHRARRALKKMLIEPDVTDTKKYPKVSRIK